MYGYNSPPSVDAANIDSFTSNVFLLHANDLYVYNYTDNLDLLIHTYTFLKQVDITENSEQNPFAAGPSSHLPRAPNEITAMWMYDNSTAMGAIVDIFVYSYIMDDQSWQFLGEIQC